MDTRDTATATAPRCGNPDPHAAHYHPDGWRFGWCPGAPEPEPLDDEGAAELAALIAAELPPLAGPGFALDPNDRDIADTLASWARAEASQWRRLTAGQADPHPAINAALWGIVPMAPIADPRQRGRELVEVWSNWIDAARGGTARALASLTASSDAFEERHRERTGRLGPIYDAALWTTGPDGEEATR